MQDVSAFGFRVRLVASVTFPQGITLTQFADDADPFDVPALTVNETAMGINGDLVSWSKANPIMATFNLIPGSDDDINMGIVLEANRVGRGKNSARDVITVTAVYPDGRQDTYSSGKLISGIPSRGAVASAGRLKAKPYNVAFENKTNS